jgi:broad specificity phosphatase PhoE
MTRLYLVRHAEAQGNFKRCFNGHIDSDISENGQRQLERLKERFKTINYDAVYSSPLMRAYKTARAANFYHGLPITTLDGLEEINGGRWEGELWDRLPLLYPEENMAWVDKPWLFAPEGGETMRHVYDRIWDTMLSIVKGNPGRTVLVASHGCAIRNFICRAKGLPLERLNEIDWFENTSVNTIDFDGNLRAHIISLNDASHLDDEILTVANQSWWRNSKTNGVKK